MVIAIEEAGQATITTEHVRWLWALRDVWQEKRVRKLEIAMTAMAVDHNAEINDVDAASLTLGDRVLPRRHLAGQQVDNRDVTPGMIGNNSPSDIKGMRVHAASQDQGSKSCRKKSGLAHDRDLSVML